MCWQYRLPKWYEIIKMLKAPALDGSILLKFPLETKLKSESFKLLVNFLAFLVEKL